jgi:hypothetical protein
MLGWAALMEQLALFVPPPQPRTLKPEPWPLYLAVLVLRRRGHRVIRAGRREHLVDGLRIYSGKQLVRLATVAKQ